MTPHQAIILAAGLGSRLRPLTDTTPKPLVPFFHRPLLDWAVAHAASAGVTRIAVNAFHHADAIAARLAHLAPLYPHCTFHLQREPHLLGTGGAIRHLAPWLDPAPFFVLNADAVFATPLSAVATACASSPTTPPPSAALLVTRDPTLRHARRLGATASPPTPRWTSFAEGDTTASDDPTAFAFCGVMLADAALPARLPPGPSCILRAGFLPYLAALRPALVETRAFFADTGTPAALIDAHVRGFPLLPRGFPFSLP